MFTVWLPKADPGNGRWQRDLSVAYDKVGDVLLAQGKLSEALQAHIDSLAIRERLAKIEPGNAGWQRDLATGHGRLARVRSTLGDVAEALTELREGREI